MPMKAWRARSSVSSCSSRASLCSGSCQPWLAHTIGKRRPRSASTRPHSSRQVPTLVGTRRRPVPTRVGLYQTPFAPVGANLGWHTQSASADQGRPLPGPIRPGGCQPWLAHTNGKRRPRSASTRPHSSRWVPTLVGTRAPTKVGPHHAGAIPTYNPPIPIAIGAVPPRNGGCGSAMQEFRTSKSPHRIPRQMIVFVCH